MSAGRSKTVLQIAHPPPVRYSKARLRRPRILIQLRQLSETAPPLPVLDVLPSIVFAPRLKQRFPRIFRGNDSLGPNDIIVTSSDSAGSTLRDLEEREGAWDDDCGDPREVIGTICQPRSSDAVLAGKAELCLDQGLAWEASPMAGGGYEFSATSGEGSVLRARWVPRREGHRRVTSLPLPAKSNLNIATRFTFSIINPTARRHPVIASMTSEEIEIKDQYPAFVAQNAPHSPCSAPSIETMYSDAPDSLTHPRVHTDQSLRSLIVITGLYVLFQEGWAHNLTPCSLKLRDADRVTPASTTSQSPGKARTATQAFPRHVASRAAKKPTGETVAVKRTSSVGAAFIAQANQRNFSNPRQRDKKRAMPVMCGGDDDETSGRSLRPNFQESASSRMYPETGISYTSGTCQLQDACDGAVGTDSGENLGSGASKSKKPTGLAKAKRKTTSLKRYLSLVWRGKRPLFGKT